MLDCLPLTWLVIYMPVNIPTTDVPKGKLIAQVESFGSLYEIIASDSWLEKTFLIKRSHEGIFGIASSLDLTPITLLKKMQDLIIEDYKKAVNQEFKLREIKPFYPESEKSVHSELQKTLTGNRKRGDNGR
jgi:hypothetical protein